jgi:N6-adenosine-specific RNA methylase IME4
MPEDSPNDAQAPSGAEPTRAALRALANEHKARRSRAQATDTGAIERTMQLLDALEREVTEAPTFAALDQIARTAKATQYAFRDVKIVADRAGELWITGECVLSGHLAELPKAKGTRGQIKGGRGGRGKGGGKGRSIGGAILELPMENIPTLEQLGIDKQRAARAHRIAAIEIEERRWIIAELKDVGKGVTPNAVLATYRRHRKQEHKHILAAAEFSENGPFGTVVIDPPWEMEKIDRDVRPDQVEFAYPTMSAEQLSDFWRSDIASRLEADCHVFMWTTQKYLPTAINLIGLLGLKYVLTMVWHKPGGFQPIDLPQYNCEFIVYGRSGSPLFIDTTNFNCCFTAPRREHSRKPDYFYDLIRRVTGGSRIDVFSREPRDGFAQYGNELAKFAD